MIGLTAFQPFTLCRAAGQSLLIFCSSLTVIKPTDQQLIDPTNKYCVELSKPDSGSGSVCKPAAPSGPHPSKFSALLALYSF